METVYIETTIPSLYFDERQDAKTIARREWTRNWWDNHRQRYRLTWNCLHLANANKVGHIRTVNTLLGLHVPQLVTPLELAGEEDYET